MECKGVTTFCNTFVFKRSPFTTSAQGERYTSRQLRVAANGSIVLTKGRP